MTRVLSFQFVLSFGDGWPLSTLLVGKLYLVVPRMLGMYVVIKRVPWFLPGVVRFSLSLFWLCLFWCSVVFVCLSLSVFFSALSLTWSHPSSFLFSVRWNLLGTPALPVIVLSCFCFTDYAWLTLITPLYSSLSQSFPARVSVMSISVCYVHERLLSCFLSQPPASSA